MLALMVGHLAVPLSTGSHHADDGTRRVSKVTWIEAAITTADEKTNPLRVTGGTPGRWQTDRDASTPVATTIVREVLARGSRPMLRIAELLRR